MRRSWVFLVIIMVFSLAFFASIPFFPTMEVLAQTFNCTVRKDVEIPYQFEYFKTRILANVAFEIKLTIRDNFNEKVYVRLIPGTNDPSVTVDEKTLTFHLGSGLYGSTKTDYEVIGSSEDDYEIPGLRELFFQAAVFEEEWIYDFDGGDARITDITISSDQARIKYIEFWDNEFRDANMHEDSEDFEDFEDLDDTDWENLTPNTGKPAILDNDDVLYLSSSIPPNYPSTYYLPYYGYPSNVYYGNYPVYYPGGSYSAYPSGPLSSFRGNYLGSFYQGYSSIYPGAYPSAYPSVYPGSYPSVYPGSYPGNLTNAFLTGYTAAYYGSHPFSSPGGLFSGYSAPFLGLGSLSQTYGYGYGIPPYGRFIY